jgi:hypothetical protein
MKKIITVLALAGFALAACAGGGNTRPNWTRKVPKDDAVNTYFVGVSKTYTVGDLQGAQRDAERDARVKITDMLSSDIKTRLSSAKVTEGAINEKINPGLVSEDLKRITSEAIARLAKAVEYHEESVPAKGGDGLRVWVLMKYPKDQMKQAIKEAAQRAANKKAAEAEAEADEKKKRQLNAARKALKKVSEQSF